MKKLKPIPHCIVYCSFLIGAFLFVYLFSCTTSPFYERHPFWFYGDSGVFQEMGVCLLHGGTPYVDLFDHKGPILWFIQAFGIWISPKWGILFLQTIVLFFSLLMLFKTIFLITQKKGSSYLITISGLFFLMAFYQRGNLCEEWSLPFIILPIYLYLKRWKNNTCTSSYNHNDILITGFCIGILAMIRLNNAAPILGIVLWHLISIIRNKEYKRLWIDVTLMISGIVLIFIICAAFYLIKARWNGVYEMIFGTFIFNFIYFDVVWEPTFLVLLKKFSLPIGFMTITLICCFRIKTAKEITIPLIISYILTLLVLGFTGFLHYFIILIPLFLITIGIINNSKANWSYLILGCCCIISIYYGYDAIDHLIYRIRGKKACTELNDGFHRFISSINTDDQKSIYNYNVDGYGPGLFANENTYQCNRIIHLTHLSVSNRLQEYLKTHGIKDIQPIWVLTQSPRPEATDEYLATHYILADSIPGCEFDPIWCWKKIDKHKLVESNE